MTRVYRAVLVATFCLLLCLPGVTMLLRPESPRLYGVRPVRYPAFEPSYDWLTAFEKYFVANLGHKRALIQLHNALGYLVLHDLQSDSVLVGRDRWLFLLQDLGWESFRSEEPLSKRQSQAWRRSLRGAKRLLGRYDIPLLYVVVPSKETVYPDFLPASATRARSVTRLDEVLSLMNGTRVSYLDLRPSLLEGRRHDQIYDSVDSHWNGRGALLGARAILEQTRAILQQPQTFADPNSRLVYRDSEADLLLILSLDDRIKAPSVALVPNRKRAVRLEPPESVGAPTRRQQNRMVFEVPDESLPKALILRDSFAEMFMPTLAEKFRRSVWIWTHELDLRLVERERPDIVIVETTERFFSDTPPRLLTRRR